MKNLIWRTAIFCLLLQTPLSATEKSISIAAASNLRFVLPTLIKEFEQQNQLKAKLHFASSGKLYAQILHGAPFDVFLSASPDYLQQLIQQGRISEDDTALFAWGKLALVGEATIDVSLEQRLTQLKSNEKLAIANPRFAPFGKAAQALLKELSLWHKLKPRLVYAENVAQALHYVVSGHAALGIVAASFNDPRLSDKTRLLDRPLIPLSLASLNSKPGTIALHRFLSSEKAQAILAKAGYTAVNARSD